jgi:hypothetical protein
MLDKLERGGDEPLTSDNVEQVQRLLQVCPLCVCPCMPYASACRMPMSKSTVSPVSKPLVPLCSMRLCLSTHVSMCCIRPFSALCVPMSLAQCAPISASCSHDCIKKINLSFNSLSLSHSLSQSLTTLLTHSGADDNRLNVAERADAVRRCLVSPLPTAR